MSEHDYPVTEKNCTTGETIVRAPTKVEVAQRKKDADADPDRAPADVEPFDLAAAQAEHSPEAGLAYVEAVALEVESQIGPAKAKAVEAQEMLDELPDGTDAATRVDASAALMLATEGYTQALVAAEHARRAVESFRSQSGG